MYSERRRREVSGLCPMLSENVSLEATYKKEQFIGSPYP